MNSCVRADATSPTTVDSPLAANLVETPTAASQELDRSQSHLGPRPEPGEPTPTPTPNNLPPKRF